MKIRNIKEQYFMMKRKTVKMNNDNKKITKQHVHIEQKNIEKIVKQWVCTTKKFDGNICSYIKSEQKRKRR